MEPESHELHLVTVSGLRAQIVSQVRDAILNGVFGPGQKLTETAIAERLGVSRAPLREALSAIEHEGLVVNIPRRGSFVIAFEDKDIEEIYSLRLIIELGALPRAVETITPHDLDRMQQLVDELGAMAEAGMAPTEVVKCDLLFHDAICCAADHSRLYAVWNNMRWQTQFLIGITSKTFVNEPGVPRQYHQGILDALRARDLAAAEQEVREHLLDAQERALVAMRSVRVAAR